MQSDIEPGLDSPDSRQRGIVLDGGRLRLLRRERSLTQGSLGEFARMSAKTIARAEAGESISLENAASIAKALDVDVTTLTTGPSTLQVAGPPRDVPTTTVSNIPIRVPDYFLGRDEALADIKAALEKHQGRVAITALHGLRGVGKTVLAAAFADRHAETYRATWWIRSETEATMRADLAGLGDRLGWVDAVVKEEPAAATVLEQLAHDGGGILLIYDNALSADTIRPYLPRGGGAHVLITSNAHVWRSVATPVRLDIWPEEIGAQFLIRRTGRTAERDAALELSEMLGGLPLAHEQAAAYCERLEISLADYAKRFKEAPARLLDSGRDAVADYHDRTTVAKTFELAIEAAAKLHPAAEQLIVLCSLLAPEPIPLFLFTEGREELGEPLASALAGDGLDEAVAALRAFALIDREAVHDERDPGFTTDTIRLHRLVREVAAARCAGAGRELALGTLIAAMAAVYPRNVQNDPASWRRARRLDAPARALIASDPLGTAARPVSYLLNQLAVYRQFALGSYAEAKGLLERGLAMDEKQYGPDHSNTLIKVDNLAHCLEMLGDAAAALPLFRRALESYERLRGPDHPDTLGSVNDLASCLGSLGDEAAALPLYRRALECREHVLGREHPDTLLSVSALAHCLQALGNSAAALPLYRRALESWDRVLGTEHPHTLLSVNNLAYCLGTLGNAPAALRLYRRALTGLEKVLGPEHPSTNIVRGNLAITEEEAGPG